MTNTETTQARPPLPQLGPLKPAEGAAFWKMLRACFAASTDSAQLRTWSRFIDRQNPNRDPWDGLQEMLEAPIGAGQILVLRRGSDLLGAAVTRHVADLVHELLLICIRPDERGQGQGRRLFRQLVAKLKKKRAGMVGFPLLITFVPEDDLPGQLFFRQVGFESPKLFQSGEPGDPGFDAQIAMTFLQPLPRGYQRQRAKVISQILKEF